MSQAQSLAALIRRERDALLADWRGRVRELPAARKLDVPALNDHMPRILEAVARALERGDDAAENAETAARPAASQDHGEQGLRDGYDIEEVVLEYSLLRDSLHALAEANGLPIHGGAFRIVSREFTRSIGLAVRACAHETHTMLMRQHDQHLAFVTHDLRTPLNAIALAVEVLVLSVSVPQDSVAARMLRVLRRNVRQLHKQVDDVLAASAAPHAGTPLTVHRRCFELWPLVEQLVHELELLAQTSDTRLVNAVPDELEVSADAKLLTRALRNLVENAIRHAPRGEIVIGAERIGSGVACWVNDNGGGIIATPLEKVFEEAETTNGGGMGLGLAIVRQIVEAHGGRIAVARKPGRGTTFRFDLPAEAPDAA